MSTFLRPTSRNRLPLALRLLFALLLTLVIVSGCGDGDSAQNRKNQRVVAASVEGKAVSSNTAAGKEPKFPEGLFVADYQAARQKAREANKPLLIFFWAPNCAHSNRMLNDTFGDTDILRLSERFVCVQIDATRHPELCKDFNIKGFPTVQFMSSQGVLLKRLAGKQTPDQLAAQMDAAIQSTAQKTGTVLSR